MIKCILFIELSVMGPQVIRLDFYELPSMLKLTELRVGPEHAHDSFLVIFEPRMCQNHTGLRTGLRVRVEHLEYQVLAEL